MAQSPKFCFFHFSNQANAFKVATSWAKKYKIDWVQIYDRLVVKFWTKTFTYLSDSSMTSFFTGEFSLELEFKKLARDFLVHLKRLPSLFGLLFLESREPSLFRLLFLGSCESLVGLLFLGSRERFFRYFLDLISNSSILPSTWGKFEISSSCESYQEMRSPKNCTFKTKPDFFCYT